MSGGVYTPAQVPGPYVRTQMTLARRTPIKRRLLNVVPNAIPTLVSPLWSTLTEVANCSEIEVRAVLTAAQNGVPALNFRLFVQVIDAAMFNTIFTPEQGGATYTGTPTVAITGDGTGASVTAVMANNRVVGFTGLVGGSGYTYANVAFSGGGSPSLNAAAYAVVNAGAVIGVFLVHAGADVNGVLVAHPHNGPGVITDRTTLAAPVSARVLLPNGTDGFLRAGVCADTAFATASGLVTVTLQGK